MKRIFAFLSLIIFFIGGVISSINPSFSHETINDICCITTGFNYQVNENIDDGTINSYNLSDEHYFLSKNDDNNQFSLKNNSEESQISVCNAQSMEAFSNTNTLSHSNYITNTGRIYLTQTTPRAP